MRLAEMRECVKHRFCVCVEAHSHLTDFTFVASLQREFSPWRDALPLVRPKGNIYKSSVQQILKPTCRAKLFRGYPCQKCANTPLSLPTDPYQVPESVSLTHLADLYIAHTPFWPINTNMLPLESELLLAVWSTADVWYFSNETTHSI